MRRSSICILLLCGVACGFAISGTARNLLQPKAASSLVEKPHPPLLQVAQDPAAIEVCLLPSPRNEIFRTSVEESTLGEWKEWSPIDPASAESKQPVQPASLELLELEVDPATPLNVAAENKSFRSEFVEQQKEVQPEAPILRQAANAPPTLPLPPPAIEHAEPPTVDYAQPVPLPHNALRLNLPTALSMVDGQHPLVGFAQWRVQQAYAQLDQANVLWLPSLQAGFSFNRHDGNLQASDGNILDVNRNSYQYGLGAGAVGAGTTPRPGIVAEFHLADAIFLPEIAEKTAWARGHAAHGVMNLQLLNVSLAYLELLQAEQDVRIVQASLARTGNLSKLTADFAAAGQGLQADADRLNTELRLVENRMAAGRERAEVASAGLAQALSIDAGRRIVPLDPTVVPVELVSPESEKETLIHCGLSNRPELREAQALVVVAYQQYKRQKNAPFVPSVLLGFSTGGFGGGQGNNLANIDDRYDFDAVLTWRVRNLGFGESASRRETSAQIQQARYDQARVMDQVAREVSEAHTQVLHRANRIAITQRAIQSAENSYHRNLSRIREGQGLPLEVLQSVQALEDARRAYLTAVIAYNQAQFRLYWALGCPLSTAISE